MKWIYDDYEFENRANNLSWTIAGDYNESIDISEKDYSSKEIGLYFAIIAGARRKYVDWDIVKKYLTNRIRKGYNKDIILGLIQVILNTIVEEKAIKDRPGIEDIRRNAYKDIVSRFTKIHNDNIMDKIKYAFVLYSMDKHPALDSMTRRIVNDIRNIDTKQDIMEVLKELDVIYLTYFEYILNEEESSLIDENNLKNVEVDFDTFADFMYEELYSDEEENIIESDIDSISSSMLVEGVGDFDDSKSSNLADRVIYVDEDTANKIYSKIEHYYGKTYLSKGEIKKIETQNCRSVHEGCRIHFTDGVLRSECNNVFQLKYVTRQKENNLGKFREHARMYRQQIKRLKESLSRILIEENAKTRVYSDCGTILANRAWRVGRSNNNKIFYKDIENEKGKYVIDILLDASGSQSRNQGNVAIQAYIIANALTEVGIPNRVMGFSSFLDYTILKRFKDYDDSIKNSENIFEYFCAGNNRDGLAIKSICSGLINRYEENKILIVLSDGRPNDIKIGKSSERTLRGEKAYRGIVGLRDTANEVRKARKQNILVLGVFTGKESELEAERLIYGNDFIYSRDITRFSDVVSMYLKKIIRN